MTPVGKSGITTPFSTKNERPEGQRKFSNDHKSMVQLPASRETHFSVPRTSLGSGKKGGAGFGGAHAETVKVNAFTENLEQKVRYMLSKT